MAVTIHDVLELDIMKGFKVVAGANGLSETILATATGIPAVAMV